ncbi:hypothetical protein ACHAW6_012524 [Cyclotella cf. meneghiniana]
MASLLTHLSVNVPSKILIC